MSLNYYSVNCQNTFKNTLILPSANKEHFKYQQHVPEMDNDGRGRLFSSPTHTNIENVNSYQPVVHYEGCRLVASSSNLQPETCNTFRHFLCRCPSTELSIVVPSREGTGTEIFASWLVVRFCVGCCGGCRFECDDNTANSRQKKKAGRREDRDMF